jgi:hypothetical protein
MALYFCAHNNRGLNAVRRDSQGSPKGQWNCKALWNTELATDARGYAWMGIRNCSRRPPGAHRCRGRRWFLSWRVLRLGNITLQYLYSSPALRFGIESATLFLVPGNGTIGLTHEWLARQRGESVASPVVSLGKCVIAKHGYISKHCLVGITFQVVI